MLNSDFCVYIYIHIGIVEPCNQDTNVTEEDFLVSEVSFQLHTDLFLRESKERYPYFRGFLLISSDN